MTQETRGVRNNNPGNVRLGTNWNGLAAQQTDGAFCQFISAPWGIRVIVKLLWAYQDYHDLDTIREIINRWAPDSENDTSAYAEYIAKETGIDIDAPLNLHTNTDALRAIVVAIIAYENAGYAYPSSTIDAAISLAHS